MSASLLAVPRALRRRPLVSAIVAAALVAAMGLAVHFAFAATSITIAIKDDSTGLAKTTFKAGETVRAEGAPDTNGYSYRFRLTKPDGTFTDSACATYTGVAGVDRKLVDPTDADGTWTYELRQFSTAAACTTNGTVMTANRKSATFLVDRTAPTTSDNVPTAWQKADVAVTLTATDNTGGSGVSKIYYEKGATPADPTTNSPVYDALNKPVLANGEQIKYFAVDNAGNAEAVKTSTNTAKVDKVAPTTTDDVTTTWSKTDVTVTLTSSDTGGSNVANTYYTKGTAPADPTTASTPYNPASKPVLLNGEKIKYFSVDAAGNAEAVKTSVAVQVDKAAPTTTDNVPTTFSNQDIPVTLSAADGTGSGVATTYYEKGATPADPTTASPVYDAQNKPTLANGEKIKYFSVDNVGNAELVKTSANTAKVDKAAPTTTDNVPTTTWSKTDISVTLTAADGTGSGISKTYYTKGTAPADPTTLSSVYSAAAKPTLTTGEKIKYFSVDVAGNAEAVQVSPVAKVDKTAPTTSDDVPTAWQKSNVTVTLSSDDAGASGVDKTYYTIGATPTPPSTNSAVYDPQNKPTLADGQKIRYFSVDTAGNAEVDKTSLAAKVDTTAPSTTDSVPATWQKSDVAVTLTATDAASGVSKVYYEKGATPADPTTTSPVYDALNKPVLADGEKIKYFAVDNAGNAEAVKTSTNTAKVDKVAPTTADDVTTAWSKTDVSVTLNASDTGGSNVDKTYYTKGTAPADPTTLSSVYSAASKPVLLNGEKIKYFSVDIAGNAEPVKTSVAVQVDKAAPTTTDNVPTTWSAQDIPVTLTAGDGTGSGVSKTYYTKGTSPATPTTGSSVYDPQNKPTLANGETIKYFSVDNVGNAELVKTSVNAAKVDKNAPSTADDVPSTWQKADVAVTLTATDPASGVSKIYYEKGAAPADPTISSPVYNGAAKPVLADGEKIKYFAVDNVGNAEAVKTSANAAKVDKNAPTTTDNVPTTWQSNDVTVTLTAADTGGSGVDKTYYEKGSNPKAPDTASPVYNPAAKPVLTNGQTIKYMTVDTAGNAEAVKTSVAAQVDKTAPSTTDNVPSTWQKADVSVTLTASDAGGVGVDKTYYEKGATPADPTIDSPLYDAANKPVLTDGQTIKYFSVDKLGNKEAVRTSANVAKVDKAAPTTTDDVDANWHASDVTVTLTSDDTGGSGVSKTYFTKGASPATPTTASTVYDATNKPTLANGDKIKYFTVDVAGNAEAVKTSSAAKVDNVAPTTTDDVPTDFRTSDITVTLTATDTNGSGVDKTYYTTGATPADPSDPNSDRKLYDPSNKPVLANGEKISYFSVDQLANTETVKTSVAAQVDKNKVPPTTTDDVDTAWHADNVTVTLSATAGSVDAQSVTTYYTAGATPADPTTASSVYDSANKPVLANGEKIKYFSVDDFGNQEPVKTSNVAKVDKTAASTTASPVDQSAWYKSDVAITLSATDSQSGVAKIEWTKDAGQNPTWTTYNASSKPSLANGDTLRYRATDNVNNVETAKTWGPAKVDGAAPTTTASPADTTWSKTAVAVTLTAVDSGPSGVAKIEWTKDSGANAVWKNYNSAQPTVAAGETLRFHAIDTAGNQETDKTWGPPKIDTAAPTTTAAPSDQSAWYTSAVAITLTADDNNQSGVSKIEWTKDAGLNPTWTTYNASSKPSLANGESLRYRATDNVGNVETAKTWGPAKVDGAAPATTASPSDQTAWHSSAIAITLSATDSGPSGLAKIEWTKDTGQNPTWTTYNASSKPSLANGDTLRYRATDVAGNVETENTWGPAKVDTAAPTTTASPSDQTSWNKSAVAITLTADDNSQSGVSKIEWTKDTGQNPTWTTYNGASKPSLANGETLRYRATDNVNNVETAKTWGPAKVDGAAPTTTASPADQNAWRAGAIAITLSATDSGPSGVDKIEWTKDAGQNPTWTTYDASSKPSLANGESLRYRATDVAGNVETENTWGPAKVDTAAPSTTAAPSDETAWRASAVEISLSADDNGQSGVSKIEWTKDTGQNPQWTTYDASSKPSLGNGDTLRYRATDNVNNVETAKTWGPAKVDTAAPTTTASPSDQTSWNKSAIAITLTADDGNGSGVAKIEWTKDSGQNPTWTTYDATSKPSLANGDTLRYRAIDNVDNVETASSWGPAKVDGAAPTTTASPSDQTSWRAGAIEISLTAQDSGPSGVDKIEWTKDAGQNPTWTTYDPSSKPSLSNGQSLRYRATDVAGNVETAKTWGPAKVDTAAPTTTASPSDQTSWNKNDVAITLTADDNSQSGVSKIEWTKDTGQNPTWTTYDAASKPTLANGETLRYRATDNVDNVETAKTWGPAKVDGSAPASSASPADQTAWRSSAIAITLSATDSGPSGLAKIEWTKDTGQTPTWTTYDAASKPSLTNGQTLRYRAVDNAGNVETTNTWGPAKVDTAAPTTSTGATADAIWSKTDVVISLSSDDNSQSGVSKIEWTKDAGQNPTWTTYDATSKPTLANGETLRYRATDNVGNVEPEQSWGPAKVDGAAPSTTASPSDQTSWNTSDVAITLNATDNGPSGVDHIEWTKDSGNAANWTAYGPGSKPSLADGQSLRYRAVDVAGNVETEHTWGPAKVDGNAPTTAASPSDASAWYPGAVEVSLSADDHGQSGVDKVEWTKDSGQNPTWTTYDASSKPNLNDGETLRYRATDVAGNAEIVNSWGPAQVDTTPPTVDATPEDTNPWQKSDLVIDLTADDAGRSGVDKIEWTTDDPGSAAATWTVYSDSAKPHLADGQTVHYRATDKVNNVSPVKSFGPAKVDGSAPTTTASPADASTWHTSAVAITLSATDKGSAGVDRIEWTTDSGDTPTWTTYDAAQKPTLEHGQTLRYRATDNAGNVEATNSWGPAKVDAKAPSTSDNVPADTRTSNITVTLTATDSGPSGTDKTYYTVGTNPADPTQSNSGRKVYSASAKPSLANGERIRYSSVDVAGNVETAKLSGIAHVSAPTTTPPPTTTPTTTTPTTPSTPTRTPAPSTTPPPNQTAAALATAIQSSVTTVLGQTTKTLKQLGLTGLLAGSAKAPFTAAAPGVLTIQVTAPSGSASAAAAKIVAKGRKSFASRGTAKIGLRPTAAGKRLLAKVKRVKVTVRTTFVPTGGKSVQGQKTVTLRKKR